MRANYVRSFYLPEHHPMPSMYVSHYQSRLPPQVMKPDYCQCGREKTEMNDELCQFCVECNIILDCATRKELTDTVVHILKPVSCSVCGERFADQQSCESHHNTIHILGLGTSKQVIPSNLSLLQLKEELKKRGASSNKGNKAVLVKRLEGYLASEI